MTVTDTTFLAGDAPAAYGRIAIKAAIQVTGYDLGYHDGAEAATAATLPLGIAIGRMDGASSVARDARAQGITDGMLAGLGAGVVVGVASVTPPGAPTIAAVTPTPGAEPGAAGGWPAAPSSAAQTPIVVDVTDADDVLVTAVRGARGEELVYRTGFRGAFAASSSQSTPVAGTVRLSLLPDGGWDADTVVVVEAFRDGAAASAEFAGGYLFPAGAIAPTPPTPVAVGSHDHVAEAFARLPWQLAVVEAA